MDPAPPEVIELSELTLRRISTADTDDLLAHFSDADVTEFLDFTPLTTIADAKEIVDWSLNLFDSGRGIRWVISERESNEFVGTCGFNKIIRNHGSFGEIAYDLGRRRWGRGIMSTVMPRIIEVGFADLGLRRLQAFVTPGNERSVGLLERHGFRHEGRLRDYGYWREAYWDQDLFALLEPEWKQAQLEGGSS